MLLCDCQSFIKEIYYTLSQRSSPFKLPVIQNGRLRSKIAFRLKKICYKVSLCENCQRQSCKVFIGLTICGSVQKWLVGRPLLPEILGQSDRVKAKSPIIDLFSLLAPQPYDLAKKVQLTSIGSALHAFQWAQDEHRTLSLTPKGWLKNAKCPKFEQ